jgi:hypothetical protein
VILHDAAPPDVQAKPDAKKGHTQQYHQLYDRENIAMIDKVATKAHSSITAV